MTLKEIAELQVKKDTIKTMAAFNAWLWIISAVAVPSGLLAWLFWPHGWKIAVAGLIAVVWCSFWSLVFKDSLEKINKQIADGLLNNGRG